MLTSNSITISVCIFVPFRDGSFLLGCCLARHLARFWNGATETKVFFLYNILKATYYFMVTFTKQYNNCESIQKCEHLSLFIANCCTWTMPSVSTHGIKSRKSVNTINSFSWLKQRVAYGPFLRMTVFILVLCFF